jgi:hypothetical protein
MQTDDLIRNIIAGLALVVSLFTAYKTLVARFAGKVFPASYFNLSHVGEGSSAVPTIILACFFENSGARPGILDDLRLVVKHNEGGTTTFFFPQRLRDGYDVSVSYGDRDWLVFGGVSLPARAKMDKYLLFQPLSDRFQAGEGLFEVTLECRWHNARKWSSTSPALHFKLTPPIAERWNSGTGVAVQVACSEILDYRKAFRS